MGEKQTHVKPALAVENEVNLLMKRQNRFDELKAGDIVKVPPYGRRVRILEKYPHMFIAMHKNGYKVCFSRGDYVSCQALITEGRK